MPQLGVPQGTVLARGFASNLHTVDATELYKGSFESPFHDNQVTRRDFLSMNFDDEDVVDKFSKIEPN